MKRKNYKSDIRWFSTDGFTLHPILVRCIVIVWWAGHSISAKRPKVRLDVGTVVVPADGVPMRNCPGFRAVNLIVLKHVKTANIKIYNDKHNVIMNIVIHSRAHIH